MRERGVLIIGSRDIVQVLIAYMSIFLLQRAFYLHCYVSACGIQVNVKELSDNFRSPGPPLALGRKHFNRVCLGS